MPCLSGFRDVRTPFSKRVRSLSTKPAYRTVTYNVTSPMGRRLLIYCTFRFFSSVCHVTLCVSCCNVFVCFFYRAGHSSSLYFFFPPPIYVVYLRSQLREHKHIVYREISPHGRRLQCRPVTGNSSLLYSYVPSLSLTLSANSSLVPC